MIAIICGGRDYNNVNFVNETLDKLYQEGKFTEIFVGGAKGADTLAKHWAQKCNVPFKEFMADWQTHGRAAGPIRNKQMLDAGGNILVAFPGGTGTSNMIAQAKARGIEVIIK